MSDGKRPGGLTALAVINFIFGAFNCLAALGMAALLALAKYGKEIMDEAARKATDPHELEQIKALQEMGTGLFVLLLILAAAQAVLQITSGVGYLKQRKFLGRVLGNTYALVAIAAALGTMFMMPEELNGGGELGTIIGLIYPLLTLLLLNTTFKEDFIN